MGILRNVLFVVVVLACCGVAVAQGGDRSPSFHNPLTTVIFPQFVVGSLGGGFEFEVEIRIGNGSDLPWDGEFFLFEDNLAPLGGILVNGIPYTPNGIQVPLGPRESVSLVFTSAQGPGPQGPLELRQGLWLGGNRPASPAGVGASPDDLSFAFFYTLRDGAGNLIDSVAVPEARAGKGIQYVMSRRPGFDTGVAIFVTSPQPVNIRVFLPQGELSPAGTTVLEGVNPLTVRRDDFFLNEFVDGLPEVIDSAVVEMTAR